MAEPRTVVVPLRRLERWVAGFEGRHGEAVTQPVADPPGWRLVAADGASAEVRLPPWWDVAGGPAARGGVDPHGLVGFRPCYGILLVRRAGYAVAQAVGAELVASKVGRRHVHGRTAAGGWSQQRYARRRDNQADDVVAAAAGAANRLLAVPGALGPTFLVTGGDRRLLAATREALDPAVAALPVGQHVGVGTPTRQVLAELPDQVLAVEVLLCDPR